MNDDRKNKNRGFKRLRVWNDSIELFLLVTNLLESVPYLLNKSKSNTIDASHSIQRNIAEGYCRRSPKEYLNLLNIALGSSGELNSSMITFYKAGYLSIEDFEKFDLLHFKMKNELLAIAKSIQSKIKNKEIWDDCY